MKFSVMKLVVAIAATAAVGLGASAAHAGAVAENQWYEFGFGTPIDPATACTSCVPSSAGNSVFADDPPWTFTSPTSAFFTVTDAFLSIDQFEVFDFGASIGTTSAPTPGGACGSDPDVCLLDPLYSHGIFGLTAGNHQITIDHIAGQSGAAYFRWDEAPEPGSLALLGVALAGLGWAARRKHSA